MNTELSRLTYRKAQPLPEVFDRSLLFGHTESSVADQVIADHTPYGTPKGSPTSSDRVYKGVLPIIHHAELGTTWDRENAYAAGLIQLLSHGRVDQKLATALPASTCTRISEKAHT